MRGKRVAIYARVSTDQQENANQLSQLRKYAEEQEWHIVGEFIDQASGARGDRPALRSLFEVAARREIDIVIFWSLDRFTREGAAATLEYLAQLGRYGVRFRSFTEPYLDTSGVWGDAIIAILATIAKQERIRISERVCAGLERARKQGTKTGNAIGRPRAVFRRDQVAALRAEGLSWSQISTRLGVAATTCRDALAETPRKPPTSAEACSQELPTPPTSA